MLSMRRLLALVWLATALVCPAGAVSSPPVRLTAPVQGTTLTAGSLAPLAWEPLGSFAGNDRIEEWEAFLSLDGGAHYPFRITPHLDLGLRRVLWRVPGLPTRDARLLLRFGDERRETAVELAERFEIAGTTTVFAREVLRVATPGEPARPGDPGVVAWVEGDRDGGGTHSVIAAPVIVRPVRSVSPLRQHRELALVPEDPEPDPAPSLARPIANPRVQRRAAAMTAASTVRVPSAPLLLLIQRQNE